MHTLGNGAGNLGDARRMMSGEGIAPVNYGNAGLHQFTQDPAKSFHSSTSSVIFSKIIKMPEIFLPSEPNRMWSDLTARRPTLLFSVRHSVSGWPLSAARSLARRNASARLAPITLTRDLPISSLATMPGSSLVLELAGGRIPQAIFSAHVGDLTVLASTVLLGGRMMWTTRLVSKIEPTRALFR